MNTNKSSTITLEDGTIIESANDNCIRINNDPRVDFIINSKESWTLTIAHLGCKSISFEIKISDNGDLKTLSYTNGSKNRSSTGKTIKECISSLYSIDLKFMSYTDLSNISLKTQQIISNK